MTTAILWFKQDLRLTDNPALYHAATENDNIIPLYILNNNQKQVIGGAQRWWLHHSLLELQKQFKNNGLELILKQGDPREILLQLCKKNHISAVYWNNSYEPYAMQQDQQIKNALTAQGVTVKHYNSSLLFEPWEITNKNGTYFKKFTPFWKKCCLELTPKKLVPIPKLKQTIFIKNETLNNWKLLPTKPNWAITIEQTWSPGELHAQKQLNIFAKHFLVNYAQYRDFPADNITSRLSPYLHFGEISPQQILNVIWKTNINQPKLDSACETFLRELGWREFSYHLLNNFPNLPYENFRRQFDHFKWENDLKNLRAWQQGQTGYPIVDAGMRELWHTGFMHNRVRMIVASFLTKHLLIDWRKGAEWFMDTLVDADLANNTMNWQWVAGSGPDSAPFFRIFNPILQGQKFDHEGKYIRRWIPELTQLPNQYIHQPWQTPIKTLQDTNITLGKDYPKPIVKHENSRKRALERYRMLRNY